MAAASLRKTSKSLSALFARYVRGEIGDPIWSSLMHLLDADDVTRTERQALARFFNDVVAEGGPAALFVPKDDEARALLVDIRPAVPLRRGPLGDRTTSSV
jgi:hypothetical protein